MITIHTTEPDLPYHALGEVRACVRGYLCVPGTPCAQDVDTRLRTQATGLGATAIVNVHYRSGRTLTGRPTLTGRGIAIVAATSR